MMIGALSNRVHRTRYNQIDAQLPEFGTRPARVATSAVAWPEAVDPNQVRVDGERQRGVSETGMSANFLFAKTLARQQSAEFALTRLIVFRDAVNTDELGRPFLVEPVRDRFLVLLV